MSCKNSEILQKIRKIADYQFGKGVGEFFFPENVLVVLSKRTGKIRHVYLDKTLIATLKPTDSLFSLTVDGGERVLKCMKIPRLWVQVQEDVSPLIEKGGDVFAKHVVDADNEIRPMEEVIVLNKERKVIAVGKAMLSGEEMITFKHGVAVKVRRGKLRKLKILQQNIK